MKEQIFLIVFILATTAFGAEKEAKSIEYDVFNEVIKAETRAKEKWVRHPVAVSLLFIEHHMAGEEVIEHQEKITLKATPEKFVDAVVTIERSGFLDDSTAGDRYVIILEKQPSNEWLIKSVKYGRRCWEGRGHSDYSNEPCS